MGSNRVTPQQAQAYSNDPTYQALARGAGQSGSGAQGVSQLAAALLAAQRQQQLNRQLGSSQANYQSPAPGVLPTAVTPQPQPQASPGQPALAGQTAPPQVAGGVPGVAPPPGGVNPYQNFRGMQ